MGQSCPTPIQSLGRGILSLPYAAPKQLWLATSALQPTVSSIARLPVSMPTKVCPQWRARVSPTPSRKAVFSTALMNIGRSPGMVSTASGSTLFPMTAIVINRPSFQEIGRLQMRSNRQLQWQLLLSPPLPRFPSQSRLAQQQSLLTWLSIRLSPLPGYLLGRPAHIPYRGPVPSPKLCNTLLPSSLSMTLPPSSPRWVVKMVVGAATIRGEMGAATVTASPLQLRFLQRRLRTSPPPARTAAAVIPHQSLYQQVAE